MQYSGCPALQGRGCDDGTVYDDDGKSVVAFLVHFARYLYFLALRYKSSGEQASIFPLQSDVAMFGIRKSGDTQIRGVNETLLQNLP